MSVLIKQEKEIFLSVVIPAYNEEDNLELLYRDIVRVVDGRYRDFEIIIVNDGSTDHSYQVLETLHKKDPRLKTIDFKKNFGQSAALSAGFSHSRGDVVVTMDGDMQNDPADIPLIVNKVLEGFDLVNGWRKDRKDKLFLRRIPSIIGNKYISWMTKVKLHDYGCTMRGFDGEIARNITLYGEMHRYIPAIAAFLGVKSIEIEVNHRERRFGKSKYGLGRTFRVILDVMALKFMLKPSVRPLHILGTLGTTFCGAGLVTGAIWGYMKLLHELPIRGRTLLFFTALFLGLGIQLFVLGLVSEMITRIYHEGLGKRAYFIRESLGFSEKQTPPNAD